MFGSDTGAADFHHAARQGFDHLQIELAGAVEATRGFGGFFGEDARAGNHFAVGVVDHHQVLAVGVVLVGVDTVLAAVDVGTHLARKDAVAQFQGRQHFGVGLGEAHGESWRLGKQRDRNHFSHG